MGIMIDVYSNFPAFYSGVNNGKLDRQECDDFEVRLNGLKMCELQCISILQFRYR